MNEPGKGLPPAERTGLAAAENATLWSLFATVTLFTAGQISSRYQLNALGIRGLRTDVAWQDRVYEGGLAVLNMVLQAITQPSLRHLPWLLAAAIFALCLWRRRRAERARSQLALGLLAGSAYLAAIILLAIAWGNVSADYVRGPSGLRDHFVFSAEAAARMPAALLLDNDQRSLRLITTTADFFIVLGADAKTSYRIATRDVELQETTRSSAGSAQ
jgi:hypothetical protein